MVNTENARKLDKIHSYPAKYTIEMIEGYIKEYSSVNDIVYDPFVGCGTTLLASNINGRIAYGSDINGIAILISKFKITPYNNKDILGLNTFINTLNQKCKTETNCLKKHYVSINHWFNNEAIDALSLLRQIMENEFKNNDRALLFAKVVFSSILTSVSNQESNTRYAAKDKKITFDDVINIYIKKFRQILEIISSIKYNDCVFKSAAVQINSKASSKNFGENSVDLIVTSPPYPNTYDYYLYHKHRMLWLDYAVEDVMEQEIGSRREFSSLKKPSEKFTQDMTEVFLDCDKMLKAGKYAVIIIGDGQIRGKKYDSKENIIKIAKDINWRLVSESCTSLDETSRTFQQSFRTKGKLEHVLIFQKEV
ncbi:MAG: site-specific DNA-methyltransferase [Christensenellaceae bacterium]|nr:site-specific DNA-methyltransferase [Christensenellaceae bacterium]